MDEPARPAGFAGFKQRLARSAAGLNALLTDDAVREKAGALLQGRLNRAVERGQAVAEQQLGACRAIAARGLDRAGERKSALSVTTARGAPALSAPVAARSAPRALRVCGTATMRPARRATRLLTLIAIPFAAGVRTGVRGVLAKVAEADALRALRRRNDEDNRIDLQARLALCLRWR